MPNQSRKGHVQFAIEVKLPARQTSLAAHREMLATCQQLDVMFGGHQIRPTWAVHESLLDAVQHAVPAETDWAMLVETSDQLEESIQRIKRVPGTLRHAAVVSRVTPTLIQVAELAALGIRAMMLPSDGDARSQRVQTRHGLSMVRTTGLFPGTGRFLGRWDAAFQAKGLVHRAMMRDSTEAISLQLDRIHQPTKALRSLQKTLAITHRLQAAGRLACETLLQTHGRLCPAQRGTSSQQSVLRAA